jgi:uncharacterized protein with GYD domain
VAFLASDHDVAHDRVSEAPDRDALDDDSGDGDQKPDSSAVEAPRGSCSAQPCDLTYTLNLTECLASMGISFQLRSSSSRDADRRSPKRRETMPLYLSKFSYTPETWSRLIGHPEDRRDAAKRYIESVGGELHGFWYAFGDHDGYTLWEAPDNASMAAVALAISGGGALSSLETTVLLTVDETMDAFRKAKQIHYRAPGT